MICLFKENIDYKSFIWDKHTLPRALHIFYLEYTKSPRELRKLEADVGELIHKFNLYCYHSFEKI